MTPSDDAAVIAAASLTQAFAALRAANPHTIDRARGKNADFVLDIYREMLDAVRNGGHPIVPNKPAL